MACFTDLPLELYVIIVQLACEAPRRLDWMLALACTSRTFYSAVEPLLYETVRIFKTNHASVLATCGVSDLSVRRWSTPADVLHSCFSLVTRFKKHSTAPSRTINAVPFRHTRRLIMVDQNLRMGVLARVFSRATAFAGTRRQLEDMAEQEPFAPTTLVLTEQLLYSDLAVMLRMPVLQHLTYLHMCLAALVPDRSYRLPNYVPVDLSRARFTHVVLDYHNQYNWYHDIVPVAGSFLAVVTLQRLLLCLVRRNRGLSWTAMTGPLTEFAHTRRDTRVWFKPIESLHGNEYCKTCPCHLETQDLATVFDRSKWLDGEPLYQPPC